MSFVKIDTRILRSSLWLDRDAKDMFLTALLLAEPKDFTESVEQLEISGFNRTGFELPPGWYGYAPASGPGIAHAAGIDRDTGMKALERLSSPDPESMSDEYEGRRLIRITGGYIILNYMRYREKDETASARMRRYRENKSLRPVTDVTRNKRVTLRNTLLEEADAEADAELINNNSISTIKKNIVATYNEFASKREGWSKCSKVPAGKNGEMLDARCRDTEWVKNFPEQMRLAIAIDWMTEGKLITMLRPDAQRQILDGDWKSRNGGIDETPSDPRTERLIREAQAALSQTKGSEC